MCDIYDYARNYYSEELVDECLSKTAVQVGVDLSTVCDVVMSKMNEIERSCAMSSQIKLKDYQLAAVKSMLKSRGVILAFEVGAGKTLTAISIAVCSLKQAAFFGKDIEVVIVTPTSLQDNFRKEMKKFGLSPYDKRFKIITIEKYRRFLRDEKKKGNTSCKDVLLIIDEAHALRKDYRGEFTEFGAAKEDTGASLYVDCAKQAWKVVLLTGTPAYNSVTDIVNLVAMVKGEEPLNYSQWSYLMSNDEAFKNYFCNTIRFYTPDRSEYPEKNELVVPLAMNPTFYEKYKATEEKLGRVRRRRATETERDSFLTKLRQSTNNLTPNIKVDATVSIIGKGNTLVYSEYKNSGIDIVKERLEKKKTPFRLITGQVKPELRQKIVNDVSEGKIQALLVTKAGREGLDLKGIRNVVILEPGWNVSTDEQIVGRAVRYRSHSHLPKDQRNVNVYHLLLAKPEEYELFRAYIQDVLSQGRKPSKREYEEIIQEHGIETPSVDIAMYLLGQDKQRSIEDFIARVKRLEC